MKNNLLIENLTYEELILLQNIMVELDQKGLMIEHDQDTFDSLYEKVMVS
jgi:homoaconitase/3-isopropylmalate dehydratase large subunit